VSPLSARRPPPGDGARLRVLRVRLSDAELAELDRRAKAVGVARARYVVAAVLERPETVNERRLWAGEVERAERMVRGVEGGIEELVRIARANGVDLEEAGAALVAIRQAADAVVAMGRAASQP